MSLNRLEGNLLFSSYPNFHVSQKDQEIKLLKTQSGSYIALSIHPHTQAFLQHFIFFLSLLLQCRWPSPDCFLQEIEQPFFFGTEYILLLRKREKKMKCLCFEIQDEFLFKEQFKSAKMEVNFILYTNIS